MSRKNHYESYDLLEDLEEFGALPPVKNLPAGETRSRGKNGHKPNRERAEIAEELAIQNEERNTFEFSYRAARHEKWWLVDSLQGFYENHWLDDILRLVKGGKEASVYQCTANPSATGGEKPFLAAKVYRPRMMRQLSNDHLYREGRADLDSNGNVILDGGKRHAINKRTEYGLELLHTSWLEHEFRTLQILHAAGADVPQPYASAENAILMEYIGGEDTPAPMLNSLSLEAEEALPLFERVVHNIEMMLAHGRVHADLSAYNILYWEGEITFIDFPQAIDPAENRNAFRIFERDITRTCEYFSRQGVRRDPHRLAASLWTAYRYPLRPEIHPSLLDEENEKDRADWRNQRGRHA